nr:hypothetical protein [Tanacetum cinerariifolium]
MATTLEQQVALDEALVPSAQRLRIGRSNFRLPSDIQSKEATLQVVYDVLRNSPFFKAFLLTVLDLEAFREMLHISPRTLGQSFAELPFEEEILEFLRFLGHMINKCLTGKSSGIDSLRNTTAYKEYYAYATGEASPKPKVSARKKKGGSASSTTPPTPIATPTPTTTTEPTDVERTKAEQLKIVLRGSRQKMHISQQRGSSTDEGTGSKPGVPDEEESFDPIPRTPEDNENDENNEEDQGLRIGEEERMQEEEEANELYRDVDINQGRGLQVSQETKDSHVILTLTQYGVNFYDWFNYCNSYTFTPIHYDSIYNFNIHNSDLSEMELKKILIDKMEGVTFHISGHS